MSPCGEHLQLFQASWGEFSTRHMLRSQERGPSLKPGARRVQLRQFGRAQHSPADTTPLRPRQPVAFETLQCLAHGRATYPPAAGQLQFSRSLVCADATRTTHVLAQDRTHRWGSPLPLPSRVLSRVDHLRMPSLDEVELGVLLLRVLPASSIPGHPCVLVPRWYRHVVADAAKVNLRPGGDCSETRIWGGSVFARHPVMLSLPSALSPARSPEFGTFRCPGLMTGPWVPRVLKSVLVEATEDTIVGAAPPLHQ